MATQPDVSERATSPAANAARALLTIASPSGQPDSVLWDRARRLMASIPRLADQPEMAVVRFERSAAELAAAFFEVARAEAVRRKLLDYHAALLDPLDEKLREMSVDGMRQAAVDPATRERAAAAIRQWTWGPRACPEAVLLAEAAHLDDIGPLWLWASARRGASMGPAIGEFIRRWAQMRSYGYWEKRIADSLRFESSRRIARRRLAAMQVFVESLEEQVGFVNGSAPDQDAHSQ